MIKNNKGFTLIEIIIGIAIIGIMSAAVAPSFVDMTRKTQLKADIQSVSVLQDMIDMYTGDHDGQPPDGLETSGSEVDSKVYAALLKGGYLKASDLNEAKTKLILQTKGALVKYDAAKEHVVIEISYGTNIKLKNIIEELNTREKKWIEAKQ